MIDYINGSVKSVDISSVTVDIGNIGLCVHVPFPAAFKIEDKANLHLYMHWNQEQGPSLYGFSSVAERAVFLIVIGCSGVGPKIGMAVLVDLGVEAFLDAVQRGDDTALSKVSGIGPKKAEQMIVQLKHKVAKLIKSGVVVESSGDLVKWQEISDVLSSLHYSRPEISAAMKYVSDNYAKDSCSFDQLIRHALSFLSKKSASM